MVLRQKASSIARRPMILVRVEASGWRRPPKEMRARGIKRRGTREGKWKEKGIRRVRAKLGKR